MDVEKLKKEINSGAEIEEVLEDVNWQEFEQTVSGLFEKHQYNVETNVWFTLDRRFEVDVIAEKFEEILCIDCKKWGMRKGKTTALKYAVNDQIKRAEAFKQYSKKKKEIYPILVTFLEENIIFEKNVPIVPVWRLNSFLLNFQKYKEKLRVCK
ncbi:MAG: restriction endonuclease [Candidatus Undinarchaeales archaeon]